MSMQDTLADMFTVSVTRRWPGKPRWRFPSSTAKQAIAKVLKEEGYVEGFRWPATRSPC